MMIIDGKTRLCGLLGDPVEHTLSPLIHNTISEKLGINEVYVPFHVKGDDLKDAVLGAYALNILGLNATVPHKSAVIPFLKDMDSLAEKIGAVNTLVRTEGGYKGYNTDMLGLYRSMTREGFLIEGEEVILLGAGGAARAVAFLCADKGAKKVYLLNRSYEKAETLAKEVNASVGKDLIIPMAIAEYDRIPERKMLAIQSTSVGLHPNVDEVVIEDAEFYKRIHTAYDLIYRPEETKFMRLVKQAGGRTQNGLGMLLYQGIIAYELWNDVQVPDELADEIFERMKEQVRV